MSNLKHKLLDEVKDDLRDIETALRKNLGSHIDVVSQVASHILFSGGKRLRPLLMVLSARICGYDDDYVKTFSIVFEYLHAATLLHDDLIDGAKLRRGKAAAHSVWGNSIAVLVGDFLLARSLSIGTETGHLKIIRIIAEITENMSQGEIQQLMRKGNPDLSEAEYMEIIQRKTAMLIQGTCRVGAIMADASPKEEEALSSYGLNMGIAFQIADDLLDYTADTKSMGKEFGADLREGKLTLPVICSMKAADPENRIRMENIIKNENFSVQDFETLLEMLKKYGGLVYAEQVAAKHIENAKQALSVFGPSKTKDIFLHVADYVLSRKE